MARLWKHVPDTPEGKYLVLRRDGTVPEWPYFVLAATDPAAPFAIKGYAAAASVLGFDPAYVTDLRALAIEFDDYRREHGDGKPGAARHRKDNPAIIAMMRQAHGS